MVQSYVKYVAQPGPHSCCKDSDWFL